MEDFIIIHCVGNDEKLIGKKSNIDEAIAFAKEKKNEYSNGVIVVMIVDKLANRHIYEVI